MSCDRFSVCKRPALECRHLQRGFWRASKRWCKGMSEDAVNKALLRFANNGVHSMFTNCSSSSASPGTACGMSLLCNGYDFDVEALRHILLVVCMLMLAVAGNGQQKPHVHQHGVPAALSMIKVAHTGC